MRAILLAVTRLRALAAGHRGHLQTARHSRSLARQASLAPASLLLSTLLLVGVVPGASFVAASAPPSGDWTQFHNGSTHQGYNSTETRLSASNVAFMTKAWTGAATGGISSSPAVANGVVYIGSSDGKLYAYAVGCASGGGTCTPIWTATTGWGISSSPAVANGVVYVGSEDDKLYAFDLPLDHLVLSPSSATIYAGGSQAYTAEGYDSLNHDLGNYTNATTFTIGGGGSCTGATCTSAVGGDHTVTGTDGTATGIATLHVMTGATYHALTPTRILDSRDGTGGLSGPFGSHSAQTFQVTGGVVAANATAVTGNLTVTGQTSNGYLFIGPVAMDNPTSSTLNFPVGDDRANAVTVALGGGGTLSVTFVAPAPGPAAHVIFDVTGYFTP
jgi:hypothetical protein